MSLVLDASAVIAWLKNEPGAERVETALDAQEAVISTVNLAEVLSHVAHAGQDVGETKELLREVGLEVAPFTFAQAVTCGELRPFTAPYGLSLGDRACLALGIEMQAQVLTADKQWGNVQVKGVQVELLRP